MSIYCCPLCQKSFKTKMSLARHASQIHKEISGENFYHLWSNDHDAGKCLICQSSTTFLGLCRGFHDYCSSRCSGLGIRKKLKNDPEKFEAFRDKVKCNQKQIWYSRTADEIKQISQKCSAAITEINAALSNQELKEKYSRYYKCNDETISRLNKRGAEILMNLSIENKTGYCTMSKGRFRPRNPQKYRGDVDNIIWRSSWEAAFMLHLDQHPDVVQWSSEEIVIPYTDPFTGNLRRYFPDFCIWVKQKDGIIKSSIVEIKPYAQSIPPNQPKNIKSKKYLREVHTWGINHSKWEAARRYAKKRGMEFQVLTEKDCNFF